MRSVVHDRRLRAVWRRSDRALIGDVPLKGTKTERVESRLLIKELTDRGMSAITARKLVEDASIPHDRIRQKIEILDWIMQTDTIDPPARPAGWLRKAIEDDYQAPAGFESAEMRAAKRCRIEAERTKQEEDTALERREREEQAAKYQKQIKQVTDHLASLPEAEREALIDESLASTNEFFRERAAKYRRNPSKKEGEGTHEMVLVNHILPRLRGSAIAAAAADYPEYEEPSRFFFWPAPRGGNARHNAPRSTKRQHGEACMYPRQFIDSFWSPDIRDEVFVAMSFDEDLKSVYTEAISPACSEDNELKAVRLDVEIGGDSIITRILDGIAHSRLVIASSLWSGLQVLR